MSIRVTGYDFIFSKSCYICEPISHIIQLRAPQCYIFFRTVAYYYDNSSSTSPALCLQYLDCLEELTTVEGLWKQQASNDQNSHLAIDDHDDAAAFRIDDDDYNCFQLP
jgi:hypothetical protein